MNIAVYPGTFDPITYGHIDVIKKSLNIFDKLIIATADNSDKNYFFPIEERIDIINNSLFKDLKFNKKKIKVISFDCLTIDLCKKYKAFSIIRIVYFSVAICASLHKSASFLLYIAASLEYTFFHSSKDLYL